LVFLAGVIALGLYVALAVFPPKGNSGAVIPSSHRVMRLPAEGNHASAVLHRDDSPLAAEGREASINIVAFDEKVAGSPERRGYPLDRRFGLSLIYLIYMTDQQKEEVL